MLKTMRNCLQLFLLEWRTDKANDNFKKINRMKKFITLMILSALCLGAKAQQINGDFDGTWENCYPWVGGNYITTPVGTQPQGWHASNVNGVDGTGANDRFITNVSGHTDGYTGVQIQNVYVGMKWSFINIGSWAPGYLSLGTPWNTSKGTSEKDGGCFGGMSFVYKPDAISFNYKFSMTQSKASFVGYLWKGTWTQTNVPSSTTATSSSTPKKAIIIDRDVCVLGKYDASKHKGDTPTSTTDAQLIASYETYVESSVDNWTACEIPFTYVDEDATPEKINIIFSSADYFSTTGAGSDNASVNDTRDVLTIDNVKLIYYHSLTSCTYDGQQVTFDGKNSASVSALYDESKPLVYEKKGVGAEVEKEYNNATGVLTITVKGNDYSADNSSKTTYTIQFYNASATLAVNSAAQYGTFCAPFVVTIPVGVQAFTISGIDKNGILTLEQQNTISAHTPVIVYSESASGINSVQLGVATSGTATSKYLTGVYDDTKAPVGSYVLQNQNGRVGFYRVQESTQPWVRANRAYLTVPASANVKAFYMDDATAIQTVEELLSGKAEIYDLAGRRQQKLQKGINIVGGKKVLVK